MTDIPEDQVATTDRFNTPTEKWICRTCNTKSEVTIVTCPNCSGTDIVHKVS